MVFAKIQASRRTFHAFSITLEKNEFSTPRWRRTISFVGWTVLVLFGDPFHTTCKDRQQPCFVKLNSNSRRASKVLGPTLENCMHRRIHLTALTHAYSNAYNTCLLNDTQITYGFATSDFLLPRITVVSSHMFARQHCWLARNFEVGPFLSMEEPLTAMWKRPQDGAPSSAEHVVCVT